MAEVTIKFVCADEAKLKAIYVLNLISSITGVRFSGVDSDPDILYGESENACKLNIPYIDYQINIEDWGLFSGRNRLVLPQFIQPGAFKIEDHKLGLDLFGLMYRFLETGLKNIKSELWAPDKINTNLRFTYPFFTSYIYFFIDSLKQSQIIHEGFQVVSPWPAYAPFAVGLSHDLDIFKRKIPGGLAMVLKAATSKDIPGNTGGSLKGLCDSVIKTLTFGKNPYDQYENWLNLDGKSTYFIFAGDRKSSKDPAYDARKVGRRLKDLDLEIALHNGIGTWRNSDELANSQKKLSEIFNHPIEGIRPHYLDFGLPEYWMNGRNFKYSSAVGSDVIPGFSAGINFPMQGFELGSGEPLDIIELPIGMMDCAIFNIKEQNLRERTIQDIINCCNSTHGLLVLDWHNRTAYRPDFPGWFDAYISILSEAKAAGAYIAPLGEIDRYWRKHCKSVYLS